MAGELFGSPIGRSLAEKDMAAMAMNQAQVEHLGIQDAMAPFTAQQRSAQARWLNARSAGAEQDAQAEREIAARMQNEPPTSAEEAQNPARKAGETALSLGYIKKAMEYGGKADLSDQRRATAAANESRKAIIEARTHLINVDTLARDVRTADSPEALQAALVGHARRTGENTGFLNAQGTLLPQAAENWEKVRDHIQESAIGEKDRVIADIREKALASADGERKSKQDTRKFWQDMGNQEDRAAAQRRGRGEKVGADVLSKSEGTKLGTDFINSEFADLPSAQAKILGRQLTERAQQLRAKQPALTPLEAVQEASKKMEASGAFEGLTRRPTAASPDRPLPLPADGDKSKLKTGQYYSDGTGVRQWLGPDKGWGGHRVKGKIGSPAASNISPLPMATDQGNEEDNETDSMAMENEEGE